MLERDQVVDARYRLIERIGSGGMADVWCAEDRMLDRRVALKFLHERFGQDQQFVERFRREAQAAAGLQHPNVVGVYDRGEWEGRHWIAMEFVEGASLKDLIGRRLSVGEAVEIIRQILAGAKFAHERGIVHRDLKPHNVLVDGEGRARVADFGIARAGASEITQTGSVLGTAQYLSPEQAQGHDVTAASDLYSVGVMLYETLTGRVPFEGDSPVAVALKQVSEQPRPPSELNPDVPPALDAVVLRALAKDPANRFASADEFLAALDAAEADPEGGRLGDTAAYVPIAAAGGALAGAAAGAALGPDAAAAAERERAAESGEHGSQSGWWTRRRAIALGAIGLLAAGVAAFALTRSEQVIVPSVIERSLSEARDILDQRGFDVATTEVPTCAPPNTVTEQQPLSGTEADEGSTVTLTVSQGLGVAVPTRLQGLRINEATERLQAEDLLVETRERSSARVKPGRVIGTDPPGGEEVDCESTVTLLVSQGPNLIDLPSLIGQQQEEAEAELRRLGFIPNVETRNADDPEGTVIGQDPGPDSSLTEGTEVTLIVSTGAGSVIVPDVEGQPEDSARQILTERGLSVRVVEQETDDESEDGRVLDQAPSAGQRVRQGDFVTIFVAEFVEPRPEPEPEPPVEATPEAQP